MKVTGSGSEQKFTPQDITITFESLKEIEYFYTIFNYGPICDAVPFSCATIRDAIDALPVKHDYYSVWHNFIDKIKRGVHT